MSHTDTSHTTGSCNWINSHILDGVLPAFFLLLQQDSRKLLSRNTWLANYSELRNTEIRFVQIVAAFVQNFFLDICIVWGFPLEALVPSVPREQNSANVSSECLSSAPDTTQHLTFECICQKCKILLSILQNEFVQIAKYYFSYCKMYLSKLQNVFFHIAKYISINC